MSAYAPASSLGWLDLDAAASERVGTLLRSLEEPGGLSLDLQVRAQCLPDEFGGRHTLGVGARGEFFAQLGIQAHRLNGGRARAERRAPALAPPGDQLVHVVAGLGSAAYSSMSASVISLPLLVLP